MALLYFNIKLLLNYLKNLFKHFKIINFLFLLKYSKSSLDI